MKIEDMAKLKEPFPETDLEWRLQSCGEKNGKFWGKALAYITSRAVQDRLDEVCGPDGWQCAIRREGDAYLCTISVRITHDDGTTEWISRTDGADVTDIEPVKGGISGAIKRCAVLFGCGRYLYNLKDGWATICENGKYSGKTKEGKWFNWNPPTLPAWALPGGSGHPNYNKFSSPKPSVSIGEIDTVFQYIMQFKDSITPESWTRIENAKNSGDLEFLKQTSDWCKNDLAKSRTA